MDVLTMEIAVMDIVAIEGARLLSPSAIEWVRSYPFPLFNITLYSLPDDKLQHMHVIAINIQSTLIQ